MPHHPFHSGIIAHIRLLDRELMRTFRELRRVHLAKQAGRRRQLDALMEDVGHIDALRQKCEAMLGEPILPAVNHLTPA